MKETCCQVFHSRFSFTRFCYARNLLPTTELEEKWTGSNAIGLSSFSLDSAYFQCLPQCPFSSAALIEAEVCFEGFHCVRPLKGLSISTSLCFSFLFPYPYLPLLLLLRLEILTRSPMEPIM